MLPKLPCDLPVAMTATARYLSCLMLPALLAAVVGIKELRPVIAAGWILLSRWARIPQVFGSLLWVAILPRSATKFRSHLPAAMTTACKIPVWCCLRQVRLFWRVHHRSLSLLFTRHAGVFVSWRGTTSDQLCLVQLKFTVFYFGSIYFASSFVFVRRTINIGRVNVS